jgi:hypothetical protein
MIVQCPRCKKINKNGKFLDFKIKHLIPGINYKLCDECRIYLQEYSSINIPV